MKSGKTKAAEKIWNAVPEVDDGTLPARADVSGMSREEFEDRVYIAVIGHSKLHDVAAATALGAWDKWQAARKAHRERKT